MKGKRKAINRKWALQAQIELEIRRLLAKRSVEKSNRFLDAALELGRDLEPAGRMAGFIREEENCNRMPVHGGRTGFFRAPDLPALLSQTIEIVISAGELLSAEWARSGGPRGEGEKAAVDVEIEHLLRRHLLELFPCDFWGEETGHDLTGHSWCWVVDPNDGTADFLNGLKGSALSIGLLYEQTPVLGVVFAPVTEEGLPDCIAWAEGLENVMRNGQPVMTKLSSRPLSNDGLVMLSAAAESKREINADLCKPAGFVAMPSIAYRLAKVAAGDGVCGVSLFPVSAHDVAAGHALLRGAYGVLLNELGQTITYTTAADMQIVSRRCFGGSVSACRALVHRDWDRVFGK